MKINRTVCAVFIIIVLIFIIVIDRNYDNINGMISGSYITDSSFNADANLSVFILHLFDKGLISSKRNGYLLIVNGNNETIAHGLINVTISWNMLKLNNWFIILNNKLHINGTIEIKGIDDLGYMPSKMDIIAYPALGKIILYQQDTIYAELYKSPILTEKLNTPAAATDISASDASVIDHSTVDRQSEPLNEDIQQQHFNDSEPL